MRTRESVGAAHSIAPSFLWSLFALTTPQSKTHGVGGPGFIALPGGLLLASVGCAVTQNCDKNLPSASRFTVLVSFNNQTVRDNNTGLVWEQAPETNTTSWFPATRVCASKAVGGTSGWRLPSVHELNSVRGPSLPAAFVPANIFTGVQGHDHANYRSALTRADVSTEARTVVFFNGIVSGATKTTFFYIWCVRGPMNADQY